MVVPVSHWKSACLGQGEVSRAYMERLTVRTHPCECTAEVCRGFAGSWNGSVLAGWAAQHWQSLKETSLSCCRLMRCTCGKPVFPRVCSRHLLMWSILQSGGRLLQRVSLPLAFPFCLWQGQFFLLLSGYPLWFLILVTCCSCSFWHWSRRSSCLFPWQTGCPVPFLRETTQCKPRFHRSRALILWRA